MGDDIAHIAASTYCLADSSDGHSASCMHLQQTILNSHRQLVAKTFPRRWRSVLVTVGDGTNHVIAANRPISKSNATREGDEDQLLQLLHGAASHGLTDTLQRLVLANRYTNNAYVDQVDRYGRTALHWAAEQGHPGATDVLLKAGACTEPRSQRMDTPLTLAALKGHEDVVRLLLEAGAGESDRYHPEDLKEQPQTIHRDDQWRSTALHSAAAGGHVAVVSLLLYAGFDKHQHDGAGLMPVEISARVTSSTDIPSSHQAVTRNLLPEDRGGKLVHAYVDMLQEDIDTVAGLARAGAFLDWQDETGDSPLHRAAHFGHNTVAASLLRAGAQVDLRNHRGGSPLHVAASTGHEAIALLLLEAGADIESLMVNGRSPLHLAVVNDKVEVVKLLISEGAYTEHKDSDRGQTPLSEASEYGLAPIIQVLLKTLDGDADVESRSKAGLTPLHWACRFSNADGVEALLAGGADPDAIDEAAADVHRKAPSAITTILASTYRDVRSSSCVAGKLRLPVAADVIGLGDPSRFTENPRRGFVGELPSVAARRLDLAAANRIRTALQNARHDRAWRRRGWLVILANRGAVVAAVAVVPARGRLVGVCGDGVRLTLPEVLAGKKREGGVCDDGGNRWKLEKNAVGGGRAVRDQRSDTGVAIWHRHQGCNERSTVWAFKRSKDGDRVRPTAVTCDTVTPSTGGTEDDGCCEAYVDVGEEGMEELPEMVTAGEHGCIGGGRRELEAGAIESLFKLAGVELGVFRNVILFL